MGTGCAVDRRFPGQPLYGHASRRGGRGVYSAGTPVGASSFTAGPDLVAAVVYAASLRPSLKRASVAGCREPAEIGLGVQFREHSAMTYLGHSPRGESCYRFVVCQVRSYDQFQGRHAIQINFIVFELARRARRVEIPLLPHDLSGLVAAGR